MQNDAFMPIVGMFSKPWQMLNNFIRKNWCLPLLLALLVAGQVQATTYTRVTNVADLAVGDQIIIVAKDYNLAMSATQSDNNRRTVPITKSDDQIVTDDAAVQVLTLQAGNKANTFAFYTGSGYLYAASSSNNWLKTENTKSNNSSWSISITSAGVATLKAQGSNTRNWLRYNESANLFSCYTKGQKDVSLYKAAACSETLTTPTDFSCSHVAHNELSFTWTAVPNASSYTIIYTDGDADNGELSVSTTTAQLTGLQPETEYLITIKAVGTGTYCDSEESETLDITTGAAPQYTVTFAVDGIPAQTITAGEKAVRPATDPVAPCEDYVFCGWTQTEQTSEIHDKPAIYDFNTEVTSPFTLYALWRKTDATSTTPFTLFPADDVPDCFKNSYLSGTLTYDGISYQYTNTLYNQGLQFKKGTENRIYNHTPLPSNIARIVVTRLNNKTNVYVGNAPMSGGTALSPTSVSGMVDTYDIDGAYSYFALGATSSYCRISSVTIYCADIYYTTQPACGPKISATGVNKLTSAHGKTVRSLAGTVTAIRMTGSQVVVPKLSGADADQFAVSMSTPEFADGQMDATYTVTYMPQTDNARHTATLQFQDKDNEGIISNSISIEGRSLPAQFAVVATNGIESWALDGSMHGTAITPDLLPVDVVADAVENLPTRAVYTLDNITTPEPADTAVYLLGISGRLWASSSETTLNNKTGNAISQTAWFLATDDLETYRIMNAQTSERHLMANTTYKTFGAYKKENYGGANYYGDIRLLPITSTCTCLDAPTDIQVRPTAVSATFVWHGVEGATGYELVCNGITLQPTDTFVTLNDLIPSTTYPYTLKTVAAAPDCSKIIEGTFETPAAQLDIVEWNTDAMTVELNIPNDNLKVSLTDEANTSLLSEALSETTDNGDGTYTIAIPELDTYSCTNLKIEIRNASNDVLISNKPKVPIIINSNTTTADNEFFHFASDICKTCDVVVRDGAVLTKASDSTPNDQAIVRNVHIYPGATLKVPAGTNFTMNELVMRSLFDEVPTANLQGTLAITSGKLYYEKRIDGTRYYFFTLPYDCPLTELTRYNGLALGLRGTQWEIKYYDGHARVENKGTQSNWEPYTGSSLVAGEGYVLAVEHSSGTEYTTSVRFPMDFDLANEQSGNKNVSVDDYGCGREDRTPNHKGWNLVGNPYLSQYQAMPGSELQLGKLINNSDNSYELTDTEIPYITVPIDGGQNYEQKRASDISLSPFSACFVQVAGTDAGVDEIGLEINFSSANRKLSAPAWMQTAAETPVYVGIQLSDGTLADETALLVADIYTAEYEMGADLEKMIGYAQRPQIYSMAEAGQMAFNAMPITVAANAVPLGYYAPAQGNYTLSLGICENLPQVEHVWLTDHVLSKTTDLLLGSYSFASACTHNNTRFSVGIALRQDAPTSTLPSDAKQPMLWAQNRTLLLANAPVNARLHLYDAQGRLLTQDWQKETSVWQRSVPMAGCYYVRILSETGNSTLSVVVR